MCKVKVSAGRFSLRAVRENLVLASLLGLWVAAFSLCVYDQTRLVTLFMRTPVMLGRGPP